MRILVTGANGFVGTAVCAAGAAGGHDVVAAVRERAPGLGDTMQHAVGVIGEHTDWSTALDRIDCVIHLAARVHVMRESAADPSAAFRQTNVAGTQALARQAARAGTRRLVFASSIKVNGERTISEAFTEADVPAPVDAYGRSKLDAEQALCQVSAEAGLEVVIMRPPLVVGAGVGGNLRRLMSLVWHGVPLPLGLAGNRRSLIVRENFADLLLAAATVPDAAGEILLAADDPPVSTATLVRWMAAGMGRRARLIPVPLSLLRAGGRLIGGGAAMQRLLDSLVVDGSKARRLLACAPRLTLEEGVTRAAAWFDKARATA